MSLKSSIYLREITAADLPVIHSWRANSELSHTMVSPFRYTNIETEQQWFAQYQQNRERECRLAICLRENGRHIGNIYLLNIDSVSRTAQCHIFIGELDFHRQGLGTFAVTQLLEHAFYDKNLNRVSLSVLEENIAAIKLYEKCGFQHEGISRQAIYKNGRYHNLHHLAILREEFK